jgi:hypothetical protein
LEVDRKNDHEVKTVCELPQAPRTDLPWYIAIEADGMILAGPAEGDRRIYRVHPDSGKCRVLSSEEMLEDRTMLAVVPGGKPAEAK